MGLWNATDSVTSLLSDDGTLSGNSSSVIKTEKAIKTYVDSKIGFWASGVKKSTGIIYVTSAVTASGVATFWITSDGTSGSNAVFTNVFTESLTFATSTSSALYNYSGITVASDKKSITVNVNQVTSVVLGLLSFSTASNGTTIQMTVLGE